MPMPASNILTEEEDRRCIDAANLFMKQGNFWPRYCRHVADIAEIDFDVEISSKPATQYIIFVGNILRPWLQSNMPDIEASHKMFTRFHEIIEKYAKSYTGDNSNEL